MEVKIKSLGHGEVLVQIPLGYNVLSYGDIRQFDKYLVIREDGRQIWHGFTPEELKEHTSVKWFDCVIRLISRFPKPPPAESEIKPVETKELSVSEKRIIESTGLTTRELHNLFTPEQRQIHRRIAKQNRAIYGLYVNLKKAEKYAMPTTDPDALLEYIHKIRPLISQEVAKKLQRAILEPVILANLKLTGKDVARQQLREMVLFSDIEDAHVR